MVNLSFSFPSSSELNLKDITSIRNYFSANTFDIVLNLAAYTSVDKAEEEKELSDKINHIGPGILAEEAYKRNIGLIHVSTDYVFGKTGHGPYKSSDVKDPLNHYGHTKSLGEDKVLSIHDKSIIIRLASVFGNYGNNFVKTLTSNLLKDVDLVFTALPNGEAQSISKFLNKNNLLIDLAADFRLNNKNDYEKIEQFDKMTIKSLSDIKVDTPIEIVLEKENGEHELIKANHSLSSDQISWFFAGSALNYIKSK